jgi:hypothetical protein
VRTPARLEDPPVLEMEQCVHPIRAFEVYVTATAAVTSTRPAPRHELFPAECHAPVATLACNHPYPGFIDEHSCTVAPGISRWTILRIGIGVGIAIDLKLTKVLRPIVISNSDCGCNPDSDADTGLPSPLELHIRISYGASERFTHSRQRG